MESASYTNWLTLGFMKEWDILDDVSYKYFKKLHDEDDIEIKIYHIDDDDRPTYWTAVFEFDLKYDCIEGCMPLYKKVTFKV